MRWSFGHITFNADRGILHNGENEVLLEPKASALLNYFCEHDHRDISRDELIERVWHGQVVSDNAINRVVVQLRKALGDDRKPRRFIATVPKVGYRFIGQPKAIEHEAGINASGGGTPVWGYSLFGLLTLTLLTVVLRQFWGGSNGAPAAVQPVSRETGWQYDADLSPDEQLLLFSVAEAQGNVLYLQNLKNGQLAQISPDSGDAGGGRWSHDGAYFVYIYHEGGQCAFRKVSVGTDGAIVANELLQNCHLNSDTTFALSLDDEILYFVERPNPFSPYVAYALDMQEQQRWRLAQPVATSYGNHYLDVHPQTGKVLLLSEPMPGQSALFEIDVPGNAFKRLQSFDYDLYSAVWGHQANTVVHPAEHPSYQLLQTDLTTGQSRVLVSDSRRISTPRRINNGRDYLFASYLYNRDIEIEDHKGAGHNSAVMDYLPEFSNAGDRLAFVSKRSGYSEVFVLDVDTDQLSTLETQDQGITYYNLSWSPNDGLLAANTSKGIVIYDLNESSQRTVAI
ncbi:MAG: winged helix-turn-helix domain-containing protein, partial [Pseudomonadota bacterium]